MSDWTPEQIAAAAEAYALMPFGDDEAIVRAVLSAVDLSDHDRAVSAATLVPYNERYEWHRDEHHGAHTCPEDDWLACMVRAVAADALRQAAAFWDSLAPEAADELFFDVADWLRARAEGVGDDQ